MLRDSVNAIFILFLLTLPCLAESAEKKGSQGHQTTHDGHHIAKPFHAGFFLGAATNTHSEHTDLALGLDSEFRLPFWAQRIGVGLIGEWVFAEHRETLVAPSFVLHPINGWKLVLAPGVLYEDGSSHREFLMRIGAAYDFHASSYSFSPTVNFDIVNGHLAIVYGITFGFGFGH